MAKEKVIRVKTGIGLGTILFLIFMVLKLTGNIDWSWWWITAPIWLPIGIIIIVLLVMLIGFLVLKD